MARLHGMLFGIVLVGLGSSATACINDSESPLHEREFRSQYAGLAGLPTVEQYAYEHAVRHNLLIGGGLVMLTGAFALAVTKARTRA
jgi:hypothetical protein